MKNRKNFFHKTKIKKLSKRFIENKKINFKKQIKKLIIKNYFENFLLLKI